jgi:hypothetical protein
VGDLTAPQERPLELAVAADAALREALRAPGRFAPAPTDDPTACKADLNVFYAMHANGKIVLTADEGFARVGVRGDLHCPSGDGLDTFRVEMVEEGEFGGPRGPAEARFKAVLARLAERAADALIGQVAVRHADDARILDVLAHEANPGLLMEAASEAGERKLGGAGAALSRLTAHPEELVALRAGAALGLIGTRDPAAIRALVEMTSGPTAENLERHLVAVNALGDIGGPEAARYLETLSVGHPEASIRELAREAVKRARGEDPSLPPPPGEDD